MFKVLSSFVVFALAEFVLAENCPNGGGEIFARGITAQGKIDVVNIHNQYRLQIANGQVPGQPRGVNLKRLTYDNDLGTQGKLVSDTCQMDHVKVVDGRFPFVGQNLYITWSSSKGTAQNWTSAVTEWFEENQDFIYPVTSIGVTGHYTQVVWADTTLVGCDFIEYYDVGKPECPYAQLYTCNYGIGGNSGGAPYKTGGSGCENLC